MTKVRDMHFAAFLITQGFVCMRTEEDLPDLRSGRVRKYFIFDTLSEEEHEKQYNKYINKGMVVAVEYKSALGLLKDLIYS